MTPSELAAIEARLRAATGPFTMRGCDQHPARKDLPCYFLRDVTDNRATDHAGNRDLFLNAPADIAALLAALKERDQLILELRDSVGAMQECPSHNIDHRQADGCPSPTCWSVK